MALISCKTCGKPVSDRAPACPHCGTTRASADPAVAVYPEPLLLKDGVMRFFIGGCIALMAILTTMLVLFSLLCQRRMPGVRGSDPGQRHRDHPQRPERL